MAQFRTLLLFTLIAMLAACCPCGSPGRVEKLPAPITLEEQTRRLTEWSRALPRIKATTVLAGVRLDYRDDKGQNQTVNAEGLLQIRQHQESGAAAPADVLLLGKSFDQPAFEGGRNAKDWWFAIKLDTKKAWIGDATKPVDFARLGGEGSASILRADLVPDLLGLSELSAGGVDMLRVGNNKSLAEMLVDDVTGTNHLYVQGIAQRAVAALFITREIVVDRISGHITEVRLYNPDGVVAVRSQLSDYAPVTYGDGVEKPAVVPQFPKRVVVSYPGQFLTVALQFETVTVPAEFKPAVFTTPDFGGQGLRIIPAD